MKQKVLVRIRSEQQYEDETPDVSEFLSEGTIEQTETGYVVSYQESELTGLQGTTTTFLLEKDRIVLKREGALRSEMIFSIDREHRSLYDMGMGALLITVRTTGLVQVMDISGGFADVMYDVIIEDAVMGQVHCHLDVAPVS